MPQFYKASSISQEWFQCSCGWRCETTTGDEAKAKKKIDLLVRLHQKVCKNPPMVCEVREEKKSGTPLWAYGCEKQTTTVVSSKVVEVAPPVRIETYTTTTHTKPDGTRDHLAPKAEVLKKNH